MAVPHQHGLLSPAIADLSPDQNEATTRYDEMLLIIEERPGEPAHVDCLQPHLDARHLFVDHHECLTVHDMTSQYEIFHELEPTISSTKLRKYRELMKAKTRSKISLGKLARLLATTVPMEVLEMILPWLTIGTMREKYQVAARGGLQQMSPEMLRDIIQVTDLGNTTSEESAAQNAISTFVQIGAAELLKI